MVGEKQLLGYQLFGTIPGLDFGCVALDLFLSLSPPLLPPTAWRKPKGKRRVKFSFAETISDTIKGPPAQFLLQFSSVLEKPSKDNGQSFYFCLILLILFLEEPVLVPLPNYHVVEHQILLDREGRVNSGASCSRGNEQCTLRSALPRYPINQGTFHSTVRDWNLILTPTPPSIAR